MTEKQMTPADSTPPPTLKVAAYSSTGGRKTLQIGHLIEAFGPDNILIVNCEQGLNTIKSKLPGVAVYDVSAGNENLAPIDRFRQGWSWIKERDKPGAWLCVDGGTRVIQWMQDQIWSGTALAYNELVSGVRRNELSAAARPFGRFVTKDFDINSQGQWIELGMSAQRMFNMFVCLKANLYWTFWEDKTSVDQYKKDLPYTLDTPGNGARDAIKGAFDFICRLAPNAARDNCDAAFTNGQLQYAKVRDDWAGGVRVPAVIPNFNLAEFARFIRGEAKLPEVKKAAK